MNAQTQSDETNPLLRSAALRGLASVAVAILAGVLLMGAVVGDLPPASRVACFAGAAAAVVCALYVMFMSLGAAAVAALNEEGR